MTIEARKLLTDMFDAAVRAAQPDCCIEAFLPSPPTGRTIVVGAGKASAAMARALEERWPGKLTGLVVTRYGYGVPCDRIDIVEAAHPVPDEAGINAARDMLRLVSGLTPEDLVICLISGGASSLLPLPLAPMTLEDKREINAALLKSGATIAEMNCVRRHLSAIKGGRLAVACQPAKLLTLAISDIPGDALEDIGSGPTVPDSSTCEDALAVVKRYGIPLPDVAVALLTEGAGESIKADHAAMRHLDAHVITAPQVALEAAAEVAREAGLACHILSDRIEGEARDVGTVMAGLSLQVSRRSQPFEMPCVLLSGGETTVSVRGNGRGGRNVEFLLSLGIALEGAPGIYAIACDTDGVDGLEDIAGAFLTPDSLRRAWQAGVNPQASLDANDGHGFFGGLGDSIVCGPTLTNVNDFRAILILPTPV